MDYIVDVERISGCLRVFKKDKEVGKDPYEFSATVVYHKGGKIAEIKGVKTEGSFNFASIRETVCTTFYLQGVDYVFWERIKGDKVKRIFMDTKTGKIQRRILL